MTEINQERFEAWLFSQPDERRFEYTQGVYMMQPGCLVCNYLRENTNEKAFAVNPFEWFKDLMDLTKPIPLPEWLIKVLNNTRGSFTAKDAKASYLTQFPNESLGTEHVAPVCSSHGDGNQPDIKSKSVLKLDN